MAPPLLRSLSWPLLAATGIGVTACFPPDDGKPPPLGALYFPVGVTVEPSRQRLYVVNSDFDLQYNAGSLQAYDLGRLRERIPRYCEADPDCGAGQVCDARGSNLTGGPPTHWCVDAGNPQPCGDRGEKSDAERLLSPGLCGAVDPNDYLAAKVAIGAFATDVVHSPRPANEEPGPPGRLFVPVRGDGTLHWIDVEPGGVELECGQSGDEPCDAEHRRGDDPAEENSRDGIRLQVEPYGVAADVDGEAVVVTHQAASEDLPANLSLFVNSWRAGVAGGPRLRFAAEGLPSGAIGIAAVPPPLLVLEDRERAALAGGAPTIPYQSSFLVTFRNSAQVRLARYFDDAASSPGRPFLDVSRAAAINTNSQGFNSRGIAVDGSKRAACEAACPSDDAEARSECLEECADTPLDVFVANRSPSSLIVGATQPARNVVPPDDLPSFDQTFNVGFGASRVVAGNVRDVNGKRAARIFVVCFDSKSIYIYDPKAHLFDGAVIHTGRGPQALAIDDGPLADDAAADDAGESYGYIAHFTDSFLGVVDLNQSHSTYGQIVLTVGERTPPRASK